MTAGVLECVGGLRLHLSLKPSAQEVGGGRDKGSLAGTSPNPPAASLLCLPHFPARVGEDPWHRRTLRPRAKCQHDPQ